MQLDMQREERERRPQAQTRGRDVDGYDGRGDDNYLAGAATSAKRSSLHVSAASGPAAAAAATADHASRTEHQEPTEAASEQREDEPQRGRSDTIVGLAIRCIPVRRKWSVDDRSGAHSQNAETPSQRDQRHEK
ncbi:unnamed protein product [Trichogramma brassicae]|uniref:Uncharacterized protein n=1 Tax=Trichogramma brassicae TaxID=86971 RepID=A0A6H5IU09_9HYME|nr:unnamed protein product [Trichogramma brassicae]